MEDEVRVWLPPTELLILAIPVVTGLYAIESLGEDRWLFGQPALVLIVLASLSWPLLMKLPAARRHKHRAAILLSIAEGIGLAMIWTATIWATYGFWPD